MKTSACFQESAALSLSLSIAPGYPYFIEYPLRLLIQHTRLPCTQSHEATGRAHGGAGKGGPGGGRLDAGAENRRVQEHHPTGHHVCRLPLHLRAPLDKMGLKRAASWGLDARHQCMLFPAELIESRKMRFRTKTNKRLSVHRKCIGLTPSSSDRAF